MKQSTLLLFSLLLIFSCKKDEPEPACFTKAVAIDDSQSCGNFATPAWACTTETIGTFTLDENSKSFLPFFCDTEKTSFTYRSENGETKIFNVDQRTYLENVAAYDSGIACTSDNTKNTAYCIEFEEANYRMTAPDGLQLTTSVYTRPDLANQTGDNAGDFLQISRIQDGAFNFDFLVVAAQKTLSFDASPAQEFYSSIDLDGITFNDVISMDISNSPTNTFKYYFSKKQGIVGFVDNVGVLWSLEN